MNTITINRNYTFNGNYPNELISAFKSEKTNLSCGFRRSTEWKIACCQSLRWEAHTFSFLPVVNFGIIGRSIEQQAVYLNLSRYFICNCCAHKARFGSDLNFTDMALHETKLCPHLALGVFYQRWCLKTHEIRCCIHRKIPLFYLGTFSSRNFNQSAHPTRDCIPVEARAIKTFVSLLPVIISVQHLMPF
ncbi:unnamed protein product [Mucor hiemalis]